MKIVATIEARMGSSRLPGKVLKPLAGRPLLERLIERLRRTPSIDEVVIATTTAPADQALHDLAQRLEVGCFRGSSDDVLDRVLRAAQAHQADLIVEITGDCPLVDPVESEKVIHTFLRGDYDYVANNWQRTYPRGLDTQVFPAAILDEVARATNDPADREHVSLYIYEHPQKYRCRNIAAPPELYRPDLRLTVDTPEDYALIDAIFTRLYPQNPCFSTADVLRLLDAEPELGKLNAHVRQKAIR